ncbi:MAG: Trk system potassium transporter TrkA [Myxococcota bacterium]
MNIVIVGMGEVGRHISSVLVDENHNVVIIDNDPAALATAEETIDAMMLQGHAGSLTTLRQANVAEADLFVAVTDNSEANLISAIRAKEEGAKRTIARVAEQAYFEEDRGIFAGMLGIDLVINPQALIALEMHKIVRSSNAVAVEDFADNRVEMIQLPIRDVTMAVNRPLRDVKLPENTLIAALIRDHELIIPGGDDSILPGDEVLAVGRIDQIPEVEKLFKRERRKYTKRVIIVGGSQTGATLAEALVADGIEVLLVERDRDKCRELSEELPGVIILHGDGTDVHLLEEERMDHTDSFVAVSGEDEINLMASLLARDLGARRVIAMVHKPDYGPICERLGIDSFLSPRLEVAKQVLKYVRAGEVVGITPVLEDLGEFVELIAPEEARIVGRPLKDVEFPRGANICAVVNEKGAFVPRGDYVIEPQDRVVVFTIPENRRAVEKAFQKPGFFG